MADATSSTRKRGTASAAAGRPTGSRKARVLRAIEQNTRTLRELQRELSAHGIPASVPVRQRKIAATVATLVAGRLIAKLPNDGFTLTERGRQALEALRAKPNGGKGE